MAVTWKKLAYADNVILKSLLTEQGDIIYASAASTPAALPHGTSTQYLKSGGDAANPSWDTPAGGGPTIVRKTADQIVNNSIVLVSDNHLKLTVAANEVWLIELFIRVLQGNWAGKDFLCGWAYPNGCSIDWGVDLSPLSAGGGSTWLGGDVTKVAIATLTQTSTQAMDLLANSTHGFRITAIVIVGGTAGTLNFQWAQNVAAAIDTTVLTNSCLRATKLN